MSSDPMRDLLTNAIDAMQGLASRIDEITALTASLKQVQASLDNVRIAHAKAEADLTEQQRLFEHRRAQHASEMEALESLISVAKTQAAELAAERDAKAAEVEAQTVLHNNVLSSMQSLRNRLRSAS